MSSTSSLFVLDLVPMQGVTHGNVDKQNKSSARTVFGFVTRSCHERMLMRGQFV